MPLRNSYTEEFQTRRIAYYLVFQTLKSGDPALASWFDMTTIDAHVRASEVCHDDSLLFRL